MLLEESVSTRSKKTELVKPITYIHYYYFWGDGDGVEYCFFLLGTAVQLEQIEWK